MQNTLILDQSYQPHRVVSWQRAVTMWWDNKVEILEEYDEDIRSVTFTIKMPAVVRLLHKVRGKRQAVKFSRINVATRDNMTCQYCLTPDQKILTADLRWVPLGDLKVGDGLVGFEEDRASQGGRRFQTSIVESHVFSKAPVFRVVVEDGTSFLATAEHRWLGKPKEDSSLRWYETSKILGKYIPRLFDVWDTENTREAGWLAGIFDGEGWRSSGSVCVAQNPGLVLEHLRSSLNERGFEHSVSLVSPKGECLRLYLTGAFRDRAKFLGQIRPERLLAGFKVESLGRVTSSQFLKVVSVTPCGQREIVKMRTTSGTFVAEGFPHHNCGDKLPLTKLTYDHVIPRSQGGKTTWENIVMACAGTRGCNAVKANRTPAQAGMRLLKQPVRPVFLPVISMRFETGSIPDAWMSWVYWNAPLEEGS